MSWYAANYTGITDIDKLTRRQLCKIAAQAVATFEQRKRYNPDYRRIRDRACALYQLGAAASVADEVEAANILIDAGDRLYRLAVAQVLPEGLNAECRWRAQALLARRRYQMRYNLA